MAAGRDPQRPHGWQVTVASRRLLAHLAPRPMVTLNPVVALAVVRGPQAGLAALAAAEADPALAGHHRVDAVRAHLLELAGDRAATREQFRLAAPHRWTTGELPEQR